MNTNAQPYKTYEDLWKKVTDFSSKDLPQSALEVVKNIYTQAKKDRQEAQIIKALYFIGQFQDVNRENNEVLTIQELEQEINSSQGATKAILQSLLASNYLEYYQMNRWTIFDRTNTSGIDKKDIATWTMTEFHQKVGELFLASLENKELLQKTDLTAYTEIINKGNVAQLRPTLYDLLAHRALEYFKNNEREIVRPAYAFEINQAEAFATAQAFSRFNFESKDEESLERRALQLYQELLAFRLIANNKEALIDLDIDRLEFVNSKSVHPNKEALFIKALEDLIAQHGKNASTAQAQYLIASSHFVKGNLYNPHGDTTNRFSLVKANEILQEILLQKDSSEGKTNAYNLANSIEIPQLNFNIEKVNIPNQPFRVSVEYRNISQLHLRMVKVDEKLRKLLEDTYQTNFWTHLLNYKAEKTWKQNIPTTNDFQSHTVEIKVDALPVGEYVLIMSNGEGFITGQNVIGARSFHVSNISYVNSGNNYYFLHRDNGNPIAQAAITTWRQNYDYTTRKYIQTKIANHKTDSNGLLFLPAEKNNQTQFLLEIKTNDDYLFMNEYVNTYFYSSAKKEDKSVTQLYLFGDRILYRPGQKVYFKGIAIEKNDFRKSNKVQSNFSTTVYLRDANYQVVDSIKVTTNEYGSFQGSFNLPTNVLNGYFSLFVKNPAAQLGFNVEEYKRPKFFVEFNPIKGSYQVNETIQVVGKAVAYAGNNITGAKVSYRVVRTPRYIYPWFFWKMWMPPTQPMEIAHGESTTDDQGNFKVDFTAIPDLTVNKKYDPVFDYEIYADITDINGETRTNSTRVSVSYKSLMINAKISKAYTLSQFDSIFIRTENMNGQFEAADLQVNIYSLKPENRLIRQRLWERPDQFVMSKAEYIHYFPHDEYYDEADQNTWPKGDKVISQSGKTIESGKWGINSTSLKPGYYLIEIITKDKNGEEIKLQQSVELSDPKAKTLSLPQYVWKQASDDVEPGQTAQVKLGTSADQIHVIQITDKLNDNSKYEYKYLKLKSGIHDFAFPVTQEDRGNYIVSWMFVKHNRMYTSTETITVPWNNKNLNIEYKTYRDKTLPGSEERWSVKISGDKKELVAAEMLGSMYDASLDQFKPHQWSIPYIWNNKYAQIYWNANQNFMNQSSLTFPANGKPYTYFKKEYVQFFFDREEMYYGYYPSMRNKMQMETMAFDMSAPPPPPAKAMMKSKMEEESKSSRKAEDDSMNFEIKSSNETPTPTQDASVQIRKNFNETAFFLPDLKTDAEGNIEFSFTLPDALTKWKFQALAHTKEAAFGYSQKEIITQKDLMVQPNPTRYLRQGDTMEFSAKVANVSTENLSGTATLELIDSRTAQSLNSLFKLDQVTQSFSVAAGQSAAVHFPITIPKEYNEVVTWRIIAKAGNHSDGEENILPVLSNKMLVTETLPIWVRNSTTKDFNFEKLKNSDKSNTLQHHSLTVEYSANPAWYAVQALPFLMEYPYDCAEQTWNRYYANSLATYIANSSPRIQAIFSQWKTIDTAALLSNLQKNEELKSILLEETPWVLHAQNEAEQKRNLALLFDLVKMSKELASAYDKLAQMQSSNGGFVWFKGGPDDRYITQYIVTGIGHLMHLNAVAKNQQTSLNTILNKAIPYLDARIKEDYDYLVKNKVDLSKQVPSYLTVQYLYMRSFFKNHAVGATTKEAYNYFLERTKKTWTTQSKYMQGMAAIAIHRSGDKAIPVAILKSLKEKAINSEEMGMYWKDLSSRSGWFWYQAPIETQALLIEAFSEIANDKKSVDDLKTWLLKNKQTTNWKTTTATAEACYALLLQGTNWLSNEPTVNIQLGNYAVSSTSKAEAGTGYFKEIIAGENITPNMGNIKVKVTPSNLIETPSASWGALYWQYFEELDNITFSETPLKLEKKLFIEKNTDKGPVLSLITDQSTIKVGDKITVRIELRVDRDMEYVHMKDMRAAALEPINVLSGYKWQGGLGYYESTKDASTNFFFSYLRKGTYVFEYSLFATHTGNFSNGITTIQSMYAPEFTANSEGVRIEIKK